jgi:hypothetical protein
MMGREIESRLGTGFVFEKTPEKREVLYTIPRSLWYIRGKRSARFLLHSRKECFAKKTVDGFDEGGRQEGDALAKKQSTRWPKTG